MNDTNYQLYDKKTAETLLGFQTKQLLTLGKENRWPMQVLGKAPMLKEPMRIQDWLLVPSTMDSTALPDQAIQRIKALFEAGIRPQGFVMVHEAPLQLTSPIPLEKPKVDQQLLKKIGGAAVGLAAVTGSLVAAVGIAIVGGLLILPAGLLAAAVIIDPILVAVMPDDSWVEIDRWDIE
ncbi:MAG: hypothetical protein Q7J07_05845 [Pelolinea sp.]|nr:hypothetical protein [Pelolinea sp.]